MATFEWSILLPFVLAGALFVTRNPWFRWYAGKGLCVSGAFLTASIGSVLLFTILWPAGVIKADFFQGLAYNTLYSSYALNRTAGMGTHWWDIYSWYYRTAPAIAVLQLIALAYFVIRVFVRREYGLWVWLLFGGLFILASLRQRQIHVHYMAPLFPVVSLFAGVLVHDIGKRLPTIVGKFVPIILAIVCILSAFPKWNKPFTDPQEVPGFSQTAAFLQKAGGLESSILATAAPLLKFYMEGYDIRDIPLGLIPLERINEIKHHRYRYVTIYRDQFELVRGFDDDPGYRFIIENLKLRHTIRHLRRGFECMWIYEDTLWKTPDRIRIPPEVFEPLTTRSGIELWHAPMDSLPIRESELIQLYSDGHIMERRSGWPYRDWRLGYYTVDTYNPRVGLVVAAPGDSGAEWIADREFAAAVPHSNEIPFDRDGLEE